MRGETFLCTGPARKSHWLPIAVLLLWHIGLQAAPRTTVCDTLRRRSGAVTDSTGRYFEVGTILVTGNRITRENIITRELSLKPGDLVYSDDLPSVIELDEQKLMNTHLFNTAKIKQIELTRGRIDLVVEVSERWYTFPVPIFELSDRNFNEWWQNYDHDLNRVNYGLRLYQYNMRGRNETLRLTAQFGYTQHYELSYRMPYIDKEQRQGLTFNFAYGQNKNLAYKTDDHKLVYLEQPTVLREFETAEVIYTYRKSFYDYHNFGYEFGNTMIADTIGMPTLNPNYLGEGITRQRYNSLYYEYISDHRDAVSYPLHGNYFYVHVQQYGFGHDDIHKSEAYAGYARFIDLKKGFYLADLLFGYYSRQPDVPYNFYGAMGYNKIFIRGYERYVIEGPQYFLNKLTLKKLLFSHIYRWEDWPIEQFRHIPISVYLKLYGDFGYTRNYPAYAAANVNNTLSDKLIGGTGLGLDFVSAYDFVFRLEYSLNSEGEHGVFIHIKKEF